MAVTIPPGVSADGMVRVLWVPAILDTTAPSIAELSAIGALDLTCYLTFDGFAPTAADTTYTDDRLCLKVVLEDIGTATWTIDNLTYIWAPQGLVADVSQKAYIALVPGSVGFFVVRLGMDVETPWAAAQKVDIYPVKLGTQVPQPPERNSKLKIKQKPAVNGPVQRDVALVA